MSLNTFLSQFSFSSSGVVYLKDTTTVATTKDLKSASGFPDVASQFSDTSRPLLTSLDPLTIDKQFIPASSYVSSSSSSSSVLSVDATPFEFAVPTTPVAPRVTYVHDRYVGQRRFGVFHVPGRVVSATAPTLTPTERLAQMGLKPQTQLPPSTKPNSKTGPSAHSLVLPTGVKTFITTSKGKHAQQRRAQNVYNALPQYSTYYVDLVLNPSSFQTYLTAPSTLSASLHAIMRFLYKQERNLFMSFLNLESTPDQVDIYKSILSTATARLRSTRAYEDVRTQLMASIVISVHKVMGYSLAHAFAPESVSPLASFMAHFRAMQPHLFDLYRASCAVTPQQMQDYLASFNPK